MPIPQIEVRQRGPKGSAKMEVTPDEVLITFTKDNSLLRFDRHNEDEVGFDLTQIPLETTPSPNGDGTTRQTAQVFAEVSGDKKKLFGVRPLTGSFFAKVTGLAHAEDQLPTPRRYEGVARRKDGTTFPYNFEGFTILVEITKGGWAGTVIPSMLRYLFADAGDGETAGIRTGGKHAGILANFLENAGFDFDTDTIPLSDNILPWLEAELVSRGSEFMIVVDNGYIESYAPSPVGV